MQTSSDVPRKPRFRVVPMIFIIEVLIIAYLVLFSLGCLLGGCTGYIIIILFSTLIGFGIELASHVFFRNRWRLRTSLCVVASIPFLIAPMYLWSDTGFYIPQFLGVILLLLKALEIPALRRRFQSSLQEHLPSAR